MKIIALFVKYDEEKYPNSLFYFKKYINKIKNHEIEIIVIDNKNININTDFKDDNVRYISGDNSIHEFSGWDKGLKYLKDNNIYYDIVLFSNDAFLAPSGYDSPLTITNDESVAICLKHGYYGNILNYPNLIINNKKINKYVRTNCFMLNKNIINKIKKITSLDLQFLDKCISKNKEIPYFKNDAPLNNITKNNIINNLEKYWHSSFNILDNWGLFRMKSLMLLNELFLLSRIDKNKNKIISLKDTINKIPNNKKIICIGASTNAYKMFEESDLLNKNIICFLDNYVSGTIEGFTIYTPEEFVNKNIDYDYTIFTMFQPETIIPQLLNLGIKIKEYAIR